LTEADGVSYGYDFNGNQTSRASDSFAWDHENRMTSATVASATTTYPYNGDGLRRSRTANSVTTTYTWDVARSIPQILQDGTYTYVYGRGMLYWVDGSGNRTYRMTDGLGSTVALANSSGVLTDTWTYDVFGAVRSHSGTNGTEFTFTGEQNDPNGLEYLRARYYDNATGRFLGRDPLGGGYPYAGNNSANRVDPTGLYTKCVDDPVWGYICYDSTQVGLPLCGPDGCHLYQGDGSAPGNIVLPILCNFNSGIDACVMPNGDTYGAYHTECYDLKPVEGYDTCGAYLGNIFHDSVNVNIRNPRAIALVCRAGDLTCSGDPTAAELAFHDMALYVFCFLYPAVVGCNGGNEPKPIPNPLYAAGRRFGLGVPQGVCFDVC